MDVETRQAFDGLRHDLEAFRSETHVAFRAVDARFAVVDERLERMDRRFDAMDRRFDAMDRRFDAMDRRFDDVIRQFGVLAEDLRDQIRVVAEGVVMNQETITRVRAELDELRRR